MIECKTIAGKKIWTQHWTDRNNGVVIFKLLEDTYAYLIYTA